MIRKDLLFEIWSRLINKIRFVYAYFKSLILGNIYRRKFSKVKGFCMFIGYPRSGHSIIGSLLDAHPNIVMGMEWRVLPHIKLGYSRNQIFYSLINNSRRFRKEKRNVWSGYSYYVSGLYQGRYKLIELVGDKHGGGTSIFFRNNPDSLELLKRTIPDPLFFIHVMRNPYDVITTMTTRFLKNKEGRKEIHPLDLIPFIKQFFEKAETVDKIKKESDIPVYDLYHEEFIRDPQNELRKLLDFLNITADSNYLQACAGIVNDSPNKSRKNANWNPELIDFVKKEMQRFEFLKNYIFED